MAVRPELIYERWLEYDKPAGCAAAAPMASWVVPLRDGRALVTLLFRPLPAPGAARLGPRTVIMEVGADGENRPWPAGEGHEAGVIFYASPEDELFGLDLRALGKVYVCRADGEHLQTLAIAARMDNLLAPTSLFMAGRALYWQDGRGRWQTAELGRGGEGGLGPVRETTAVPEAGAEVRFPFTHLCRDGCLYVLDHDAMTRLTKYVLRP